MTQYPTKEILINNAKVIKKQGSNLKEYFIVFDNDANQGENAYFCFENSTGLKTEQLERLEDNYQTITRIKLTYYEREYNDRLGKYVVDFKLPINNFSTE